MRNSPLLRAAFALALVVATSGLALADADLDGFDPPTDCDDNNAAVHPGAVEIVGDGIDEDCNATEICYLDNDDDNYRSSSTIASADVDCNDAHEARASDPLDCNDNDPSISPGAVETAGDGVDQDCDGHEVCYQDLDDDGYRTTATQSSTDTDCNDTTEATAADPTGDCDDSSAAVHPGAPEVCDPSDVDEDCDGAADDLDAGGASGKTQWYADGDSDSFGAGAADLRCSPLAGEVATAGDCDDSRAAVHPGAPEVCDPANADEDCDGAADDSDPEGASGKTQWYADADADGYGAGSGTVRCDPIMGEVPSAGDCDDGDASISPGQPEVCDPLDVDEDCDGAADDLDASGATGKTQWYADADSDGYGTGSAELRCNAPPGKVATAGDCDDGDAARNPGEPEDCDDTVDNNCDLQTDCADSTCSADAACTTEVLDHLECFKIKTTERLKGTVDLDPGANPPFALASGCTISKASKYCVPVTKTVTITDTSLTPDPGYAGSALTDDRICYKVKCPTPALTTINVHDQFGTRTFEKFKTSEVCTPAQQVP